MEGIRYAIKTMLKGKFYNYFKMADEKEIKFMHIGTTDLGAIKVLSKFVKVVFATYNFDISTLP